MNLVRAIVTDNQDPEKLGRVKVRYPWLGKKSGQAPTEWARVVQTTAHAQGSGHWSLPDVDDEVLVGFEFGEADRPIVMGSLYSSEHRPVAAGKDGDFNQNGSNQLVMMKNKRGQALILDGDGPSIELHDDEGAGLFVKPEVSQFADKNGSGIFIKTQQGKMIVQDPAKNLIEFDEKQRMLRIADGNGNTICLSSAGISVQDNKGTVVQLSQGGVSISDASGNSMKATGAATEIRCSGQVTISGGASVVIEGGAQISLGEGAIESLIKGTSFMAYFNTHTHQTPDGPSSPPMVPMLPTLLSTKVRTE